MSGASPQVDCPVGSAPAGAALTRGWSSAATIWRRPELEFERGPQSPASGAVPRCSLLAYLPIEHLQRALMDLVRQTLPSSAAQLLTSTVESVARQRSGGMLWFGLTFALLSASNGFSGIMQQLNVVY